MKKLIILCITAVMALPLVACGGGDADTASVGNATPAAGAADESTTRFDMEAVMEAIVGLWLWNDDSQGVALIFREDGTVTQGSMLGNARTPDVEGTFKLSEFGTFTMTSASGDIKHMSYTLYDGVLRVIDTSAAAGGWREFTKDEE